MVDFFDNNHQRRRLLAFSNKRESSKLAEKVELLLSCRGRLIDSDLSKWLTQIPPRIYKQIVEFELLDTRQIAAGKPLEEHIADFRRSLLAKGRTEDYANLTSRRVQRVIEECGFIDWPDISASKILKKIVEFRKHVTTLKTEKVNGKQVKTKGPKDIGPISAKSKNYYLQAIKQFCKWMVQDRRATESPVKHLQSIDTASDDPNERRALELDEMRRLLETTKAGPDNLGMTGYERALLYRTAAETGLRANELRSLNKLSFDFKSCTVMVKVGSTKNSKKAVLPLKEETAAALQQFLAGKMPKTPAFKLPSKYRMADMIRADCEAAGIDCEDNGQGKVDFHSLRHTTGTLLAASGVHPKVAQTIMRHSDINLTMSIYTHTLTGQESRAIANLPDLTQPSEQKQQAVATRTDNVIPPDWTHTGQTCVQQRLLANTGELKNRGNNSKTAILNTPGRTRTCDLRIRNPYQAFVSTCQ